MTEHTEEVARVADVVDEIRIVCDECLTVARHRHLPGLDRGLLRHLAIECHDGPRIVAMPFMLARIKRSIQGEARRPWSLRCELHILAHHEIDAWIQRLESEMGEVGAVIAELQRAVKDGRERRYLAKETV